MTAKLPKIASSTLSRRSQLAGSCPSNERSEAVVVTDSSGGVHDSRVKMTVKVMSKIEVYLDEDCRRTCQQMDDRIHSYLGVTAKRKTFVETLKNHVKKET
ncbi:Transposase [Phytophthora megakarya]|uniref:Transposase n=1 Tax=Phytophthora megakarya TaxID=4795 RepID=A0A225V4H8_9STRA|nr:Transposase [Phytophthora megakarya]